MSQTRTRNERETKDPVLAELNFYSPPSDGVKPYYYMYAHEPQRNYSDDSHVVPIHDIRGHENEFTLDKNGFQVVNSMTAVREFTDDAIIKDQYYKEVEKLLKRVGGAYKVIIFNHTIRRAIPEQFGNPPSRTPVERVHIDQTFNEGEERVRLYTGDEAEKLFKERVQAINVWRSINGVVEDHPLALGDYHTVLGNDLVPITLKYEDRDGEIFGVKHSDKLRFYYKSRIDSDEVYLIKCYENKLDGRARFSPHTAFTCPNTPDNVKPRESIEVRALLFIHEQT